MTGIDGYIIHDTVCTFHSLAVVKVSTRVSKKVYKA